MIWSGKILKNDWFLGIYLRIFDSKNEFWSENDGSIGSLIKAFSNWKFYSFSGDSCKLKLISSSLLLLLLLLLILIFSLWLLSWSSIFYYCWEKSYYYCISRRFYCSIELRFLSLLSRIEGLNWCSNSWEFLNVSSF
jgi:hypothetical protein